MFPTALGGIGSYAAGFLRIKKGENALDNTGVHPESYTVVNQMAKKLNMSVDKLLKDMELLKLVKPQEFISEKIGLPTLTDIVNELKKPGLDIRGAAKTMQFEDAIKTILDLTPGMKLPGKITNLTKFGAFVDLGLKENGLIHKSQMVDRYIEDPSEVLQIDQEVLVRVTKIDLERKRIQLSLTEA